METLRLDLHNHSNYSPDSSLTVDDLIDRARALGLDGFALTDHDSLDGNVEAAEKGRQAGIVIIPACEVSSYEGHVIGLFLKRSIRPRPLRRVLEDVRAQDGVALVSHPLRPGGGVQRAELEACMELIDGLEVYNPDNTPYGNKIAWQLARKYNKLQTGGSDTHFIQNMGHSVTLVQASERTLEAIQEGLRAGRARAAGRHAPPCACSRCAVYHVLEPIGRARRFQALPLSSFALRQANRIFARAFYAKQRKLRW